MRGIIYGLMISVVLWTAGCETWKRAYVAIHDSVDEALAGQTNAPPVVIPPVATNPVTVKPDVVKACSCDLTKPTVWPLQFMGDKATVDGKLGASDGCGNSGRRDCRAMLMRPDNQTWGYKYVFQSGCLEYSQDANQVRIKCFEFRGQTYHFVGWSTQESISTMTKATPGEWLAYKSAGHGMFLFFEARAK